MVHRRHALGIALVLVSVLSFVVPAAGCPKDDVSPPILRLEQCNFGGITIDMSIKEVMQVLGAPDRTEGPWERGRWIYEGLGLQVWLNEEVVSGFRVHLSAEEIEGKRTEPEIRLGATPGEVKEIMGNAPSGRLEYYLVYPFASCCVGIELHYQNDVAHAVTVVPPPERWPDCEDKDEEICEGVREFEVLCSMEEPE